MKAETYDTSDSRIRDAAGRLGPWRLVLAALRNLAALLFIVAIPVALLTTNIRFMANEERVYRYALDEFGRPWATSGIERAELLRAGAELRAYFNNDVERVAIRVRQDGTEKLLFTPRETDHLVDVKDRFRLMNRVQEVAVVYVLVYVVAVVLWARELTPRRLALQVMVGAVLTLAVVGGVGVLGLSGFGTAWEDFHTLIFSNDFWRLNPNTHHLIQMFPLDFWQSIVFFIGLIAVFEAALILIGAGIYLGVTNRPAPTRRLRPAYVGAVDGEQA